MSLKCELVRSGTFLFRWRSYVPLLLLPVLVLGLWHGRIPSGPGLLGPWWGPLCLLVACLGLLVRAVTIGQAPTGTSGRTTMEPRAEVLNTTGIYSLVRHPLYFGNFLMWLGLAMFTRSWCVLAIVLLAFWVYYERIMLAEEDFLQQKFGADFESWAARTPAFLPRLGGWVPSADPVNWRAVLAREHSPLAALISLFAGLELLANAAAGEGFRLGRGWTVLFFAALAAFLIVRWLKGRELLPREGT